jgi:multiple sugar transport system permease protein
MSKREKEQDALTIQQWNRWWTIVAYVVALTLAMGLIFPPFWMILTSFKPARATFAIPPVWTFIPTFEHYRAVLAQPGLLRIVGNTVVISLATTSFTLLVGTCAAYSMARYRTGGQPLLYTTLVMRLLPPIVIGLPFFVVFSRLGLINTLHGLVIAYTSFMLPNTIWLMMAFFGDIAREIEEAALVDGCSRFRAFRSIAVPLARPGLIVTSIYNLVGAWNHFFFALLLSISEKSRTLPVQAATFVGEYAIKWGELSAIGTLLILPPMLVAVVLQRHLVRGLTLGAVKG